MDGSVWPCRSEKHVIHHAIDITVGCDEIFLFHGEFALLVIFLKDDQVTAHGSVCFVCEQVIRQSYGRYQVCFLHHVLSDIAILRVRYAL
jgi:hypothetical protein